VQSILEQFPVKWNSSLSSKKIASGGAKIPCPSGTGNLLQAIAPQP
jgi:hypothetical protein